ncbi:MAG: hypothetical protein ACK4F7_03870, partial [Inhella sp.]
MLAAELLAADSTLQALADEWVAACLPLPGAPDTAQALDEWRVLCAAARELPQLQQALAAAQLSLSEQQAGRAADAATAAQAAQHQLAERQQQLEAARRESGLLAAQLQDLQRQLAAQLARERDAHRQQLQQQAAAEQRLAAELEAQRARGQQMLVDIHRLQDALYDEHELAQGLAARAELGAEPLLARLRRLHPVGESTTPPHLGLDLWLEALQLGDRQVERQSLRLVQHHGRAGLALFRADGDPALLSSWQPQGREDAGEFMLLVPEDEPGQQRLAQFPTSDWLRLQALLALLRAELLLEPGLRDTRWPGVALQLQRLLAEMAPRLRYDGLQVSADGEALCV